jgi:hypothetical protein
MVTHPHDNHSVISMASRKRNAIDLDTKYQIRSVFILTAELINCIQQFSFLFFSIQKNDVII